MLINQNQSKTCTALFFLFLRLFFAARGHPSFFLGVPRVFLHMTCHLCTQMFCFKRYSNGGGPREDARACYSTVPHEIHDHFQMIFWYKKVIKSVPKIFDDPKAICCDFYLTKTDEKTVKMNWNHVIHTSRTSSSTFELNSNWRRFNNFNFKLAQVGGVEIETSAGSRFEKVKWRDLAECVEYRQKSLQTDGSLVLEWNPPSFAPGALGRLPLSRCVPRPSAKLNSNL